MQLGIHAQIRRARERPGVAAELDDIEKAAGRVPPDDLPHGGYDVRPGQAVPANHALPAAFAQQCAEMLGAGMGERADRLDVLAHHRHRRPSVKRFGGGIPVFDDAMRVADDDAFGGEIGQPHRMRGGEGGLVAARCGALQEITHLMASPADHRRASSLRDSVRIPDGETGRHH